MNTSNKNNQTNSIISIEGLENWLENFNAFFSTPQSQEQLQELFHVYLQTERANCKSDRNKKLFLTNQLNQLLTILKQD